MTAAVLDFPQATAEVQDTLENAKKIPIKEVLVLSTLQDGTLVCLSNNDMTVAHLNWLCDLAKAWVLQTRLK